MSKKKTISIPRMPEGKVALALPAAPKVTAKHLLLKELVYTTLELDGHLEDAIDGKPQNIIIDELIKKLVKLNEALKVL